MPRAPEDGPTQLTREMDVAAMDLEFDEAAELGDSTDRIEADLAA